MSKLDSMVIFRTPYGKKLYEEYEKMSAGAFRKLFKAEWPAVCAELRTKAKGGKKG